MGQPYDLVLHVAMDDARVLGIALSNIAHYMDALPEHYFRVVLLANGPAVTLFRKADAPHAATIATLKAAGVAFQICANALKNFEVSKDQVLDACDIVPAGVVALVDLQRQGFAYIKP